MRGVNFLLLIRTTATKFQINRKDGPHRMLTAYAFGKCFDRRPSDYREGWPEEDVTPSWPGTLAAFLHGLQKGPKPPVPAPILPRLR